MRDYNLRKEYELKKRRMENERGIPEILAIREGSDPFLFGLIFVLERLAKLVFESEFFLKKDINSYKC